MECPLCGAENEEKRWLCHRCGADLRDPLSASPEEVREAKEAEAAKPQGRSQRPGRPPEQKLKFIAIIVMLSALVTTVSVLYLFGGSGPRRRPDGSLHLSSPIRCLAFQPEGRTYGLAVAEGTAVKAKAALSGEELEPVAEAGAPVRALAYRPDGLRLAIGDAGGNLHVVPTRWARTREELSLGPRREAAEAKPPVRLNIGEAPIDAVAVQKGTGLIACASGGKVRFALDGSVLPNALWSDDAPVRTVQFSPDGHLLAGGCADGRIRLWSVKLEGRPETDTQTRPAHGPLRVEPCEVLAGHAAAITSLAFGPEGRRLASGGAGGSVRVWDVEKGEPELALPSGVGGVHSVAIDPTGRYVACGGTGGRLILWNVRTGRDEAILTAHDDDVLSVSFSRFGGALASGDRGGTVHIWRLRR